MAYKAEDGLPPIHPGQFLHDELAALGLSARKFAVHIGVPPNSVTGLLKGEQGITAAMALRLGKAFGTGERYWMDLQSLYEAKVARARLAKKIAIIKPLIAAE